MPVQTLAWRGDALVLLDQTLLPLQVEYLACRDVETVARAIEELKVRGAPAIGVAAAYGVAIGAQASLGEPQNRFSQRVSDAIERLARTRPTAVNLFWALEQMRRAAARRSGEDNRSVCARLLATANRICEDDREVCRRLGRHGAALLEDGQCVLTHCNAGGLATADYGTALGVIYAAQESGKRISVFADETRPLLQGARLTAWELQRSGVEVTLICDSMAATVMRRGQVDCAIVGADRVAANGDVANKIGTYGLAILAREHGIPFYVAAPISTVDLSLACGDSIPIEERRPEEITCGFGRRTAPVGVKVYNPAFDVTPAPLVTAIISEWGIARPPFAPVLRQWVAQDSSPHPGRVRP
ncbi:MAG: S-methyl-5-thioribose-1-phosphate isomerase [Candidatus Latescibacterota bacterium]